MYILKNALTSENTTIRKAAEEARKQNIRRNLISKETEKRLADNNLTMDIDFDSAIMPLDKLGNGFIDYPDILRICKAVERTTSTEDVVKKYLEESKSISIEDVVWRPIYEHDNSRSKYSSPSRKLPFGGITGVIYMLRNTNFEDQFDDLDAYLDHHYNRYLAWTRDEVYRIRIKGQNGVSIVEISLYNLNQRSKSFINAIDEQANDIINRAVKAIELGEESNPYQATWH